MLVDDTYKSEPRKLSYKVTVSRVGDIPMKSPFRGEEELNKAWEAYFSVDNEVSEAEDEEVCPTISFSNEQVKRFCAPWWGSLIVKVLGRRVGYMYLKKPLDFLWRPKRDMKLIILGCDFLMVKFEREDDRQVAISDGPRTLLGHYFTILEWVPNFNPEEAKIAKTAARGKVVHDPSGSESFGLGALASNGETNTSVAVSRTGRAADEQQSIFIKGLVRDKWPERIDSWNSQPISRAMRDGGSVNCPLSMNMSPTLTWHQWWKRDSLNSECRAHRQSHQTRKPIQRMGFPTDLLLFFEASVEQMQTIMSVLDSFLFDLRTKSNLENVESWVFDDWRNITMLCWPSLDGVLLPVQRSYGFGFLEVVNWRSSSLNRAVTPVDPVLRDRTVEDFVREDGSWDWDVFIIYLDNESLMRVAAQRPLRPEAAQDRLY
ncbi:hypothetical protein CRG98_013345 [Punica granatum]|uniref:DUF4283 domain-containing protein n=1 Tax=Punica granatum TaxID=22663 RepID=A0A2I0KCK7_PUNGR|nr:hypothetical protein CRG98_013345 [Punica granatum]